MPVLLKVNGRNYTHFKSLSVQRSLLQAAGQFELTFTNQAALKPGDFFELHLNQQPALAGYIDALNLNLTATQVEHQARGRDAAADLVDCSLQTPSQLNNLNLLQLVQRLTQAYQVPVSLAPNTPVGEAFASFSLDPGQSVWQAIEEACRQRAVLAVSNGVGGLLLTRGASSSHPTALVEGQNVLTAQLNLDHSQRYHTYTCLGQQGASNQGQQWQPTGTVSQQDQTAAKATVTDPAARKGRTLVQVQELDSSSQDLAEKALWEKNVRQGKSQSLQLTLAGFGTPQIYQPGQRVNLHLPSLEVSGQWLIEASNHHLNQDGLTTQLTLVPPTAYSLIKEGTASSSNTAKHPWERIDKTQDIIQ